MISLRTARIVFDKDSKQISGSLMSFSWMYKIVAQVTLLIIIIYKHTCKANYTHRIRWWWWQKVSSHPVGSNWHQLNLGDFHKFGVFLKSHIACILLVINVETIFENKLVHGEPFYFVAMSCYYLYISSLLIRPRICTITISFLPELIQGYTIRALICPL